MGTQAKAFSVLCKYILLYICVLVIVSIRFVSIQFVSFRFVSFRFALFRVVSFRVVFFVFFLFSLMLQVRGATATAVLGIFSATWHRRPARVRGVGGRRAVRSAEVKG